MAHHYNSSCKQCYRYDICTKEEKTHLKEERIQQSLGKGSPFAKHVPSERKKYQKEWEQKGRPVGVNSNFDCFKSPQERAKDIENTRKGQKKKGS